MKRRLLATAALTLSLATCSQTPQNGVPEAGPLDTGVPTPTSETTTSVPENSVPTIPAPTIPSERDLIAECWWTVDRMHPEHPQARGWARPVCHEPNPEFEAKGIRANGYVSQDRTIHLTPQDQGVDMARLYLHEVGHSYCVNRGDTTEACADAWADQQV